MAPAAGHQCKQHTTERNTPAILNPGALARHDWKAKCNRFAIVEWIQTTLSAEIALGLRIYAITRRNKLLAAILSVIVIIQCIIIFYTLTLKENKGAQSFASVTMDNLNFICGQQCLYLTSQSMRLTSATFTQVSDCIVFGVTIPVVGPNHPTRLAQTIERDGAVHFRAILSGNAVWMLMSLFARPGLKFMNAQLSVVMTSVMVTRLTLSAESKLERGVENLGTWAK
ncbi:hypothetical protein BD779DRAFT_1802758 [Infundibulicybe gibba]|nr:hypothetical protein BD779DRAFT_1802758 [Infundibulicybe gibba]